MSKGQDRLLPDLFVRPDFDGARAEVSFTAPEGCSRVGWEVLRGGEAAASGELGPASPRELTRFAAEMPRFSPWTLEEPFLYLLRMELTLGGKPAVVERHFGMRKFHVEGRRIFFNNRPFFVKGHIRGRKAHDHPDLTGASEEAYYEKNIRAAKRYGFNLVRFHSKVPPESYFCAADRLGFLTHVELRRYYGKYQAERELLDHQAHLVGEEEWREMILRLRNHPSLMVYCLGNEIDEPGKNPEVARLAALTKELDPTRLFIDTCARGEYDRGNVDLDVQHMGYFCPFGENHGMFETTRNWGIFGSVEGREMVAHGGAAETRREVHVERPVVAHEICHYVGLRDLDRLAVRFEDCGAEKPWWIDGLRKLVGEKGLEKDYSRMLAASQRYQYVWWKQAIESARRSPILSGFHFLQLADTERYENANGLLDCFDDPKGCAAEDFLRFNADSVLVADLPRRSFFEGAAVEIPIWLSHFSPTLGGEASLDWKLVARDGSRTLASGEMDGFETDELGLRKLCTVKIRLPESESPVPMVFRCRLIPKDGKVIENEWNLWLFPDRPGRVGGGDVRVEMSNVDLRKRYPQLFETRSEGGLFVADRFTEDVFEHLEAGGDVLMLYRVAENRDRKAPREEYYLPSTQDRFKGVIWDRGHNLGAFIREHASVARFPHDGFLDFQFYHLIDDCDKVCLDDFPVPVEPVIQGVDKASRDRYDVFTFKLRELQPKWTMRRFAYTFELWVGKGRLFVCGFNFSGVERGEPAVCGMFENLLAYVQSGAFRPKAKLSAEEIRGYLREKGRSPRTKERMMTQYWQLDAEPLESAEFWKEAEAWIRGE